jgi:membrane-bound metal-dependent hydrolase YbcI (DUF457 family)
MFLFGHLGLGLKAAKPFDRGLPVAPLLFGTILPDLIDKPLYYSLSALTHHHGAALGIVAGTRSFGHTILFAAALAALGRARRSPALLAVALGCGTHILLDVITDIVLRAPGFSMQAFLWPLMGWQFPVYHYRGWHDHLLHVREPFLLACEIVGATLLLVEWRHRARAAR